MVPENSFFSKNNSWTKKLIPIFSAIRFDNILPNFGHTLATCWLNCQTWAIISQPVPNFNWQKCQVQFGKQFNFSANSSQNFDRPYTHPQPWSQPPAGCLRLESKWGRWQTRQHRASRCTRPLRDAQPCGTAATSADVEGKGGSSVIRRSLGLQMQFRRRCITQAHLANGHFGVLCERCWFRSPYQNTVVLLLILPFVRAAYHRTPAVAMQ